MTAMSFSDPGPKPQKTGYSWRLDARFVGDHAPRPNLGGDPAALELFSVLAQGRPRRRSALLP